MNATKSIAIVAAALITAAGMVGIVNYSNAAANANRQTAPASIEGITTLPAIQVVPSAEQLQQLRDERARTATNAPADATMPYYSFAADAAGA